MWIIKKTVLTYSVRDSLAPEDETQRISYKTKITNSQDADFWQLKEDCCLNRLAPKSTTPSLFCGDLTVATFLWSSFALLPCQHLLAALLSNWSCIAPLAWCKFSLLLLPQSTQEGCTLLYCTNTYYGCELQLLSCAWKQSCRSEHSAWEQFLGPVENWHSTACILTVALTFTSRTRWPSTKCLKSLQWANSALWELIVHTSPHGWKLFLGSCYQFSRTQTCTLSPLLAQILPVCCTDRQ